MMHPGCIAYGRLSEFCPGIDSWTLYQCSVLCSSSVVCGILAAVAACCYALSDLATNKKLHLVTRGQMLLTSAPGWQHRSADLQGMPHLVRCKHASGSRRVFHIQLEEAGCCNILHGNQQGCPNVAHPGLSWYSSVMLASWTFTHDESGYMRSTCRQRPASCCSHMLSPWT